MKNKQFSGGRRLRSGWRLASHAEIRAQQRGTPAEILELLTAEGATIEHQIDGRRRLGLTRNLGRKLVETGYPPSLVDAAERKNVIVAEDGTVVTVLHAGHRNKTNNKRNTRGKRRFKGNLND